MPGYELINVFEAAFPVYRLNISTLILHEQDIPVVGQFILKLIHSGIKDVENICGFLGLSEQIVEDYILELLTQELVTNEYVQDSIMLLLTAKGYEVMERMKFVKPEEVAVPLVFDSSTGVIQHSGTVYGTFPAKKLQDMNLEVVIPAYLNTPKLEDIDFSEVRTIIKKIRKDNPGLAPPEGELYDITALEKCWVEYKKLRVLVFYSVTDEDIMVQIFEKTQRVPEYEKVIMRMEREGLRVLPTNRKEEILDSQIIPIININIDELKQRTTKIEQVHDRVRILTKQIPVDFKYEDQELGADDRAAIESTTKQLSEAQKELETLQNEDRILSTYEHRPILEQALKEAKHSIIIVSPWIKGDGMDNDLISGIEKALQKKVEVHIGYGISKEKEYENWSVRKLKNLQSKSYGKHLKIHYLGNTHEKILICDEKFAVVTSFNWMSFKGSPDRGFRRETGYLFYNREMVNKLIDDINHRFNEGNHW